jgi:hypothetical protein
MLEAAAALDPTSRLARERLGLAGDTLKADALDAAASRRARA